MSAAALPFGEFAGSPVRPEQRVRAEPARAWTPPAERARLLPIERARGRLVIAMLGFVALTLFIALRLTDLALSAARPLPAITAFAAAPRRADIVDRNGVMLASGVESYALAVHPHELVAAPATLAPRIAAITGEPVTAIAKRLGGHAQTYYLGRRVPPAMAQKMHELGEPGIEIVREPGRVYPNAGLASHILGFIDIDGHGASGIERGAEVALRKANAAPLMLSIDARVQQALESELADGMATHQAIGAAGVVLDVHTGEVVAMASLPGFDPNIGGRTGSDALLNRATMGVYELGSAFKSLTFAMAFDSGLATMDSRYDARAPLHIAGFTIHDDHAKNRILSVPEAFIYSSNIATACMAEQIGPRRQQDYLGRVGFLKPLQIELPERGRTITPVNWGNLATMTIGYGHGISVTPLHLATAYAALVNGGIWRPATLMRRADGAEVPGTRVFSQATSDKMRALMRLVVLKGTGRQADAPGYRVGGKTGTANKVLGKRYTENAVVATFASAFPMDAPRYVVVAMMDAPKGTKATFGFKTAGWTSAPVTKRIVGRIAPMLGVPASDTDVDVGGLLPGDAKAEE